MQIKNKKSITMIIGLEVSFIKLNTNMIVDALKKSLKP